VINLKIDLRASVNSWCSSPTENRIVPFFTRSSPFPFTLCCASVSPPAPDIMMTLASSVVMTGAILTLLPFGRSSILGTSFFGTGIIVYLDGFSACKPPRKGRQADRLGYCFYTSFSIPAGLRQTYYAVGKAWRHRSFPSPVHN
jgi:hypothetical protein